MKTNYLGSLLTSLFFALLLTSCGGSGTTEGGENGKLQIAVIPKGTTNAFWKSIHAGAAKAGKELDVDIVWQGPQKEDDRQLQIQVVQNFVSRNISGIVLAPLDERSLVPPVKAAINRKIPVVIIDSDLQTDGYASFISTNNIEGGKLCAERMAEVLGKKGKVIVLRYQEGSASTTNREEGFLQKIKEYPDIEVISSNQFAGATIEKGFQASQNLLNRFEQVDGVFCSNESATTGMLRALETAGKDKQVKLIGFDSSETMVKALREEKIQGLAVQNPFEMGYLGVKTIVEVIKGEKYENKVETAVEMVTPDNLDQQEIKDLINPPIAEWLQE